MQFSILTLLLSSPLFVLAIPAALESRQTATGYQTSCVNGASISFDDGPYTYETELIDEMVSYGTPTSFFVNGYNWGCIYDDASVASLRHAYESGFTIGSHTWNHYDITTGTVDQLGAQLDLVETALLKILGVKPAMFRPPYGAISDEYTTYLNGRGYTVVGWSEDSGDSVGDSLDEQIANVNTMTTGSIILAHETYQTTVESLVPQTVPGLIAKGVKILPIDQCLNVAPYQAAAVPYGVKDETWTCAGTPAPGSGQI